MYGVLFVGLRLYDQLSVYFHVFACVRPQDLNNDDRFDSYNTSVPHIVITLKFFCTH